MASVLLCLFSKTFVQWVVCASPETTQEMVVFNSEGSDKGLINLLDI